MANEFKLPAGDCSKEFARFADKNEMTLDEAAKWAEDHDVKLFRIYHGSEFVWASVNKDPLKEALALRPRR